MSKSIANAGQRQPVFRGKHRVSNLWQRRLADGTLVFDFAGRLHRGEKPTMRRLEASTVADAIAELAELRVDAGRGKVARADRRLTVRDLIAKYLEFAEPRLGAGTLKLYRLRLGYAERELGSFRAADVDVRAVRVFAAKLADGRIRGKSGKRLAPLTQAGVLTAVSSAFEFGREHLDLPRNPVQELGRKHRPSTKRLRKTNYLAQDELKRLLAAIDDPTHRTVLTVLAYSGLRVGECLALLHRDVDLEGGVVTVVKGKTEASATTAKLLPAAVAALKAHRRRLAETNIALVHPDAFALANPRSGRPPNQSNTLRTIKRVSGGTVTQHDLRHSLAAAAIDAGASAVETARMLRHSSPAVTMTVYAGLLKSREHAAIEKLAAQGVGA